MLPDVIHMEVFPAKPGGKMKAHLQLTVRDPGMLVAENYDSDTKKRYLQAKVIPGPGTIVELRLTLSVSDAGTFYVWGDLEPKDYEFKQRIVAAALERLDGMKAAHAGA